MNDKIILNILQKRIIKMKRLFTIFLSLIMMFSLYTTAFANTKEYSESITTQKEHYTALEMNTISETEEGYRINFELTEEDEVLRKRITVAYGYFDIDIYSDNASGRVGWSVTLTNADMVTGVDCYIAIRKDLLGLYNPLVADVYIKESYDMNTMYISQDGEEPLTFLSETLTDDQAIIVEWIDFVIYGVNEVYYINDGNVQGKVSQFR